MISSPISVIIPTHYRNDRLASALDSIENQRYDNVESIVVDDSGESHASSTVESYENVTYIPLDENRGAHRARQVGLEAATGDYIQFLDDDDRLYRDKLSKQVELLQASEEVDVVYCGHKWEDGIKVLPSPQVKGDVLEHALMFRTSPCNIGTMLIETDTLEQILPLKNLHGADDIGMQIELAQVTQFDYADEVLYHRGDTVNSRGTSLDAVDGRKQILRTYDELYDEYPARVRQAALAEMYLVRGQYCISQKPWSAAAIRSFARALRLYPGMDLPYLGSFVASLFGRDAYAFARRLYSRHFLGPVRRGKRF